MKEKDGTKAKTKNGNEASERKRKTEILRTYDGSDGEQNENRIGIF